MFATMAALASSSQSWFLLTSDQQAGIALCVKLIEGEKSNITVKIRLIANFRYVYRVLSSEKFCLPVLDFSSGIMQSWRYLRKVQLFEQAAATQ